MTYIIGTDVDLYNDNNDTVQQIDFLKMSQMAKFTIVRAGQNIWIDPDFLYNWSMAKKYNLPRGSYWFYDSRIEPKAQAELYVSVFNGDFGELPLFIDIEKDYGGQFGGWQNWKIFLDHLKLLVGNKEIGIYTGFYFWKDNVPSSEDSYFVQYPLWIAGYNSEPQIPNTWKDKGWLFWQYTESGNGKNYGTESSSIDLNYYNGDEISFKNRFNISSTVVVNQPETVLLLEKQYYDGVNYKKYQKTTSHGLSIYHVVEADIGKIELYVSPQLTSRKYVPDYLDSFGLDFAVNGDGFISTTIAGYASSEGNQYGKLGVEEPVYIGKDNSLTLVRPSVVWNAISHPNRLVIDGKIVPINKDVNDIRARTAWGYTKDQKKIFFLWVDGADYAVKQGFNFPECAEILLNLGCDVGVMQDGGGSTTASIRDNGIVKILGIPYGEDDVVKYPGYKLRRVANSLGFRVKNKSIPISTVPPVISVPVIPPVDTKPSINIKKITIENNDGTIYTSSNFLKI